MFTKSLLTTAALVTLALAKTDLQGCTSSEVIAYGGASLLYYVPGTGEICSFLDCGGGAGAPVLTQPGCPLYSGTASYAPSYLPGYGPGATSATVTVTPSTTGSGVATGMSGGSSSVYISGCACQGDASFCAQFSCSSSPTTSWASSTGSSKFLVSTTPAAVLTSVPAGTGVSSSSSTSKAGNGTVTKGSASPSASNFTGAGDVSAQLKIGVVGVLAGAAGLVALL